ncbi:MAG: hypothetical protein C6I05_00625 [Epsilonproteobacteria bacterium]|nr:hypothetical protein [Campylobacterota bacterium]
MKRVSAILLSGLLVASLGTSAFAKSTPPAKGKKRNFEAVKKEKIERLKRKLEIIEKRLSCIKKAKRRVEIRQCEKKYPLVKRGKRSHQKGEIHKRKKEKNGRERER